MKLSLEPSELAKSAHFSIFMASTLLLLKDNEETSEVSSMHLPEDLPLISHLPIRPIGQT